MNESVIALTNSYLCLLAWFMAGIPHPFIREAYRVKDEIEKVLRVLTDSQLTGVELALAVKDKFSHDALSEEQPIHSSARLLHREA